MLLIYYRTYVTHAFLGFLFGIDDSAVGRNINPLQPLLAGIFRIPERRVELDPEDEIRELFFDATERPTRRPDRGQREFYSGKKKRHTIKTQVVVVRRAQAARAGCQAASGSDRRGIRVVPGQDPRQEDLRRGAGGRPGRREADGGHGVHRDRTGDADPEAARGRVDGGPEGREPAGIASGGWWPSTGSAR